MTRFTDLVGCRLPIQLAAMSGIATPPLAAAVSNAGGLGMVGVGRSTVAATEAALDELACLTGQPVGAGLIVEFLDRDILALVAERLPIVEFFWGWPNAELVRGARVVGWQVGTVDEARAAVDAGCSYVVAQGVEAGGHVRGTVPLVELLRAVRDAVDVAVVASGGIGTAADVRRLRELGADAVRVGTRFVAAVESNAHDRYVELLAGAGDNDTVLTEAFGVNWPDAPHRVLSSALRAAEQADGAVGTLLAPDGSTRPVPRLFVSPPNRSFTGDIDAMALYAGAGSTGAVTGRLPAAAIIAELLA
jgi:NAD(P)H-dependent flavin oxidoreductase YrpB (nitropropane dioxygenase family)